MRTIYNEEKVKLLSYAMVCQEHPEWSEAHKKEVAYSEEKIKYIKRQLLIADCVGKMYDESEHKDCFDFISYREWISSIIELSPEELIPNINEYIDCNPLSNIRIHGQTVEKVLSQCSHKPHIHFFNVIEAFGYWKKSNYQDKDFCVKFLTW